MKVRLRWVEEQLVIVEYQEIEISDDEYPELTEQIYDLINSEPGDAQMAALAQLEHAMQVHKVDGIPIFDRLAPYDGEQEPVSQVVADVRESGFIPALGALAEIVEETKETIKKENQKRGYV